MNTSNVLRTIPRPTSRLIILIGVWAVLGAVVSFGLLPAVTWYGAGILLVASALVDMLTLYRMPTPIVHRRLPDILALEVTRAVELELHSGRRQKIEVFDLLPGGWKVEGLPRTLELQANKKSIFSYDITPHDRGDHVYEGVHLCLFSALGLWRQLRTVELKQTVRVFPNFAPLAKLALFSAEQASRMVGAHLKRRRGEGTDFHQMREYRIGDTMRQIDWKATRRAGKLISREYQEEKNQQVVMVLDSGRRMLAKDDGLSHFDHALNAMLVVSYLALRQGDAVGMYATGEHKRWVSPRRGVKSIESLLKATYDLQPEKSATDYYALATELTKRQTRRSLVMIITNLRDEDGEDLLIAVKMLQRRHMVVVASIREQSIEQVLENEPHELADVLRAASAAKYMEERDHMHKAFSRHGVTVIDVTHDRLPGALIEHYLMLKRKGAL